MTQSKLISIVTLCIIGEAMQNRNTMQNHECDEESGEKEEN